MNFSFKHGDTLQNYCGGSEAQKECEKITDEDAKALSSNVTTTVVYKVKDTPN